MSNYEVNFKRLALLLLPTFMRLPLLSALLHALLEPVSGLHIRLLQYRKEANYRLRHNGQVCYLEAVLNDVFDPAKRRIYISDTVGSDHSAHLYKREADRPLMTCPRNTPKGVIINRRGFSGANSYDFCVNIPAGLRELIDEKRLKALTNSYKLASKRYALNFV